VARAGDSVLIPGLTVYGFRAGPAGCRFLNFRPRRDRTYYSRADLVARRRQEG
jgi:hypothetical protein